MAFEPSLEDDFVSVIHRGSKLGIKQENSLSK